MADYNLLRLELAMKMLINYQDVVRVLAHSAQLDLGRYLVVQRLMNVISDQLDLMEYYAVMANESEQASKEIKCGN